MNKYLKYTICFLINFIIILCSCKSQTKDNVVSTSDEDSLGSEVAEMPESNKYEIFGITASANDVDVLLELQKAGLLKIDSLELDKEKKLKFAVVEFASVKFGVNPGLTFLTSRCDKEAIDSLVNKISSFYGEPEETSDYDDEEPQYNYYKWNAFDSDKPYIFVRPIHSEEGGLAMMWN